jgi:hypothetical protein
VFGGGERLRDSGGRAKLFGVLAQGAQDVKCQALRRLLADARQAFEFSDQPRQFLTASA